MSTDNGDCRTKLPPPEDAVMYLVRRIQESPDVRYYLGYGTEAFSRLAKAYAHIKGIDLATAEKEIFAVKPRGDAEVLRLRDELDEERAR